MHVVRVVGREQFLAVGVHFLPSPPPKAAPSIPFAVSCCCYFFVHKEHLKIAVSFSPSFRHCQ